MAENQAAPAPSQASPTSPSGAEGKEGGGEGEEKKTIAVKRVGNYELGKILGQGSFSKVRYGVDITNGSACAIKVIDKALLMQQHLESQLQREVSIMKEIKHKNVVNLIQVMRTAKNIYIVLELVEGGELYDLVQKVGRLEEEVARRYFRQLIAGLAYVHKNGVAHRDLKPENILLTTNQTLKVSDFGLANSVQVAKSGTGGLDMEGADFMTRCGTPSYVAPEVLTEPGYNGFRADTWSCGVILFLMLSGRLPFVAPDIPTLYKRIQTADYRMSSAISEGAADLIRHVLVPSPADRYSLKDITQHPWFQNGITAEEVKEFDEIFNTSLEAQRENLANFNPIHSVTSPTASPRNPGAKAD